MTIGRVAVDVVRPLRRSVLREGRAEVAFAEDDDPSTIHVAALDPGGTAVGAATFLPDDPASGVWQLRAMAVDPSFQGTGVGRRVLEHGIDLVRAAGGRSVWAHGRDSALGFYQRLGWRVVGEQYTTAATGLPHHRVERSLGERGHLDARPAREAGPDDSG